MVRAVVLARPRLLLILRRPYQVSFIISLQFAHRLSLGNFLLDEGSTRMVSDSLSYYNDAGIRLLGEKALQGGVAHTDHVPVALSEPPIILRMFVPLCV